LKLKPAQRDAAEQAWQASSALLESGAQGASLLLLAELERAVHSARVSRLHRLAAAGMRVAQQLRDLHAARPEFRLAALTADVHQLLLVAHAIRTASGEVDARWIGEARRGYTEIGDLRLWGLFTEAVAAASGYAGTVTYLASDDGSLWSLGDIAPGDVARCRWAYVTPFDLGEVSLTHRALGRAGLRLEHATASESRRLGSGRRITAELADGVGWSEPPLDNLWAPSLRAQLDRAWTARTDDLRRAGDDLLFLRGRVLGPLRDAVVLDIGGGVTVRGVAPSAHAELAYRQNLALLSGATGRAVWLIGRVAFARPRTVELLAIGGDQLALPEDWCGRVNLGLDRLQAAHLPARTAALRVPDVAEAPADPLLPLERRLEQLLLGGRTTASSAAVSGFARDEALLAKNQLPTAATLLRRLREEPSADAWLAARVYLTAAQARLQKEDWLA
jgi:hypothetical protein